MKKEIKQFNLELLQGKKVAVNCVTEEQAQDFVNWVHSLGVDNALNTCWNTFKGNTCYELTKNCRWWVHSLGYVSSREYYDKIGYKIVSYEEALLPIPKEEPIKQDKQNSKPIIRQEFIQKVKTEKIGVICNSVEELEVWYDFLDKHMDKSLGRPLKSSFISKDILNYIISNSIKYGVNINYSTNNGFYKREGFIIYNFKDIIYQQGDIIEGKEEACDLENYLVYVKGKGQPKVRHTYENAIKEAKRLSAKEIGFEVSVVQILKTFKSEVIVNEIKEK